jgi:hypothetical protein
MWTVVRLILSTNTLFNRSADEGGKAYYEALLKDKSVADAIAIIGGGATGERC